MNGNVQLIFNWSKAVIYRYRQTQKEKKSLAFKKTENLFNKSFICDALTSRGMFRARLRARPLFLIHYEMSYYHWLLSCRHRMH